MNTTLTTMTLTVAHLHLMRSLLAKGWPRDLLQHLAPRCGATQEQWQELVDAGLVEVQCGRWVLTDDSKKVYRNEKSKRCF